MRYLNEDTDLKLYAVAGTQTVLLSFDIAKNNLDGKQFLGFSIERKDKLGRITFHNGSKHFDSLADNPDPAIKNSSLIQSFYWHDYTVDPDETYTYTIKPMFGTALNHSPKFPSSLTVTTEKLHDGMHSVYFNYGVTGSQAYANNKEFGNQPVSALKGAVLQHALAFLGRDLWSEGLVKFVRQAAGANFSIYGAFYEFQYEGFLQEFRDAVDRGVDLELVVSGKSAQYDDKKNKSSGAVKSGNKSMIKKFGLTKQIKTLRTKPSQPHNKFMVLCQDGKPKQVWTGSTNITLAGIFGQCNTGHWIVDDAIADKYLEYWNGLIGDPPMKQVAKVSETIQADTDLTQLSNGNYLFFSPRDLPADKKTAPHLQHYADLIDSADELVCMVFPFNMDEVFNTVYKKDKRYLRLLIFEKNSDAQKVKSNDTDLKVTAGDVYAGNEKGWAKEISAKTTTNAGILYVHNKFFIIDPLTDHPVVVTGSANFSNNSIRNNDENSILIKGNGRVADIYLTEFDRLFVHFWPRYLATLKSNKNKPQGFDKPLDETYSWHNDYFDPTKFGMKRKLLFKNMYGAQKG